MRIKENCTSIELVFLSIGEKLLNTHIPEGQGAGLSSPDFFQKGGYRWTDTEAVG